MAKRKIIEIDRDKCDGCGLCTTACAEGALVLDDENKAVLVREIFCDGMGACLDICPTGALKIVEREGEAYHPEETFHHVLKTRGREAARHVHGIEDIAASDGCGAGGCPGSRAREIRRDPEPEEAAVRTARSELSQWPVQLHLVSPHAPYFHGSDLLVAADCTAFALGGFHSEILRSKKLVIACPKLDDVSGYTEKLAELIRHNHLKSLTVAVMTVPCCNGLRHIVQKAVEDSGISIPVRTIVVGIDGVIQPENV